ncbi:MAG: NADH-quinone oxidoreductase subunit K [Anaerolineales bacterium]|nr:NADH-quinone oxidoreductase subunit K [Anaerolineales bacterium]
MSDTWIINMAFVALLVAIGLYALLTMKNLIRMLIGIEIVSKGILLALIATGYEKNNILTSQSLAISFIVVEVCVLATALAVIINIHRHTKTLDIEQLTNLKG